MNNHTLFVDHRLSMVTTPFLWTGLSTFIFAVGLSPRFQSDHYIHYRQLYQNFKKSSIKSDTIKIPTQGL